MTISFYALGQLIIVNDDEYDIIINEYHYEPSFTTITDHYKLLWYIIMVIDNNNNPTIIPLVIMNFTIMHGNTSNHDG